MHDSIIRKQTKTMQVHIPWKKDILYIYVCHIVIVLYIIHIQNTTIAAIFLPVHYHLATAADYYGAYKIQSEKKVSYIYPARVFFLFYHFLASLFAFHNRFARLYMLICKMTIRKLNCGATANTVKCLLYYISSIDSNVSYCDYFSRHKPHIKTKLQKCISFT